jgi:hypothetical protein
MRMSFIENGYNTNKTRLSAIQGVDVHTARLIEGRRFAATDANGGLLVDRGVSEVAATLVMHRDTHQAVGCE